MLHSYKLASHLSIASYIVHMYTINNHATIIQRLDAIIKIIVARIEKRRETHSLFTSRQSFWTWSPVLPVRHVHFIDPTYHHGLSPFN